MQSYNEQNKIQVIISHYKIPFVLLIITILLYFSPLAKIIIPKYILIHTFFELFAVSVSFMIFLVFFSIRIKHISSQGLILSFSFLLVGVIDMLHIITYPGMPNFFDTNATNTSIYFWIIARISQSIGLLAAAVIPYKIHKDKYPFVLPAAVVILVMVCLTGIGKFSHHLPMFFHSFTGMTRLKIIIEVLCGLTCLLASVIFLFKKSTNDMVNESSFSLSCAIFAIMSIGFVIYVHPHDVMNFWSHILKSISYVIFFLAIVKMKILSPYERIELIQNELNLKIDNIKLLESELERSRKIASLGSEVRGMAHDLNNVLMIINNSANSILKIKSIGESDELIHRVEQIKKATSRSHDFLKSLLNFSRNISTAKEKLNLAALSTEYRKLLQPLLPSNVQLTFSVQDQLEISMQKTDFEQLIFNLVVNARDAIDDNQGKIHVTASNVVIDERIDFLHYHIPVGEYVSIKVEDNGCGIEEHNISKIFEPFYTTKLAGKGTGIGLATVLSLIQKNNAYILVDSSVGKGTTFITYFLKSSVVQDDVTRGYSFTF